VRPIAVGCILRRFIAKTASQLVVENIIAVLMSPRQLGFGVRGGAEAAVHVTRIPARPTRRAQITETGLQECFHFQFIVATYW